MRNENVTIFLFQAKLTNLAIQIGYGGMAVSLVTVIILSVKFSVDEFYTEVIIGLKKWGQFMRHPVQIMFIFNINSQNFDKTLFL